MPAFIDTMAYVNETPWHGLGVHLAGDFADSKTMQVAAGLDWTAKKLPVFYDENGNLAPVPDQYTIVRSDTGKTLGCTVGGRYTPFQNEDLFAWGDAFAQTGEARWETAGSLHGGRKVWGLAQVAGAIDVRRRDGRVDQEVPYLLIWNAHDGTSSLVATLVRTRVVCANTAAIALGEGGVQFRCPHTASVAGRVEEARETLGVVVEEMQEEQQRLQQLADTPMSGDEFRVFVCQLISGKDDVDEALDAVATKASSSKRSRTIIENQGSALTHLFREGRGNDGADRFDAFNSVTEWIDHQRGRVRGWQRKANALGVHAKQFDSGQFGSGAKLKKRAMRLLSK